MGCNAEYELRNPESSRFYETLAAGRPIAWVIPRGVGASQREIPALSLDAVAADVEAVADCLGWETFDLWGEWSGNLAAMLYAARTPERVGRIVLWSASADWKFARPGMVEALSGLVRTKWSLARRTMGGLCFPTGPLELYEWFVTMLGEATSPEMAIRYLQFQEQVDLTPLLPSITAPALLLHRRGDRVTPISAGRALASLLPNARFAPLEGDIAFPYFGDLSFIDIVREFLDEDSGGQPEARPAGITARELHVLRLVAAGLSNRQIAEELCISINTTDRHVSNILTKIGASNRAEAAAFAVRNGIAS